MLVGVLVANGLAISGHRKNLVNIGFCEAILLADIFVTLSV
jgi:hypothetical protein